MLNEYRLPSFCGSCENKFDCFSHVPLFCGSCGVTRCKNCYLIDGKYQCISCFDISLDYGNNYDLTHKFIVNLAVLPNPGAHSSCSMCLINHTEDVNLMLSCGHGACYNCLVGKNENSGCSGSSNIEKLYGSNAHCKICDKNASILRRDLLHNSLITNANIMANLNTVRFFSFYSDETFIPTSLNYPDCGERLRTNKYLCKILSYDLRPIFNHLVKQGTPQRKVLHALCEYKKFMILKWTMKDYNATKLSPSPIVDLVWHTHILFTKSYYEFCRRCFRNVAMKKSFHFVHHNPDGMFDDKTKLDRFLHTINAYIDLFNSNIPDSWFSDEITNILSTNPGDEGYQIFVKGLDGTTHTFRVIKTMTIFDLKLRIQAKMKVPLLDQRLIFAGTQLDDGWTFGGTRSIPSNVLNCVGNEQNNSEGVQVNVKVDVKSYKITLYPQNTLRELMEYIHDKTGLSDFTSFSYNNKSVRISTNLDKHLMDIIELSNDSAMIFPSKVSESGIGRESTLHLVLRLRGC